MQKLKLCPLLAKLTNYFIVKISKLAVYVSLSFLLNKLIGVNIKNVMYSFLLNPMKTRYACLILALIKPYSDYIERKKDSTLEKE